MTMTSSEQRDYTSIFRLDDRKVVVVGGGNVWVPRTLSRPLTGAFTAG